MARLAFDAYGASARHVHVFDAFAPLGGYGSKARRAYLAVDEETVRRNFVKYGAWDGARVHLRKGLFHESVRRFRMATSPRETPLAVLRVDGNFYESYEDVFYWLYNLVPVGGVVILDDYGSPEKHSCSMFVRDFWRDYAMTEELHRIDFTGAWFRKAKRVDVDFARRRYKKQPAPAAPLPT